MTDSDITLDQQLPLQVVATRLGDEFGTRFGVETIERFLRSSYDEFAGRATRVGFLRHIRDDIERRVIHLPTELQVPEAATA
jgi:hypothetical protein